MQTSGGQILEVEREHPPTTLHRDRATLTSVVDLDDRRGDDTSSRRGGPDAGRGRLNRPKPGPGTIRRRLMLADLGALLIGIASSFALQAVVATPSPSDALRQLTLIAAALPVFAVAANYYGLYRARANLRQLEEAANIAKTVIAGAGALLFISFAAGNESLSRIWVGGLVVGIGGATLIERRAARSIFTRLRRQGRMQRRIIVVGTDAHAINLVQAYAADPSLGYRVVGVVGDDWATDRTRLRRQLRSLELDLLGGTDDLSVLLDRHDAVGVVVSLSSVNAVTVNSLTRRLTDGGYHVALSSSLRDIDVTRLRPQTHDGRTMIYVEPTLRTGWRAVAKRIFDLALSAFIMMLTLPIQLAAAVAIKLTSAGPVFFRQVRVGRDGELFEVLKFRTMHVDAEARKAELMAQNEADGPLFKMRDDPRITRVGRLLRKLSIDELPQLINVMLGSMSMVGPRPALPVEVEQWDAEVRERLRVLPGLTGMWQVSGRSDSSFETYKRMDLYYVDNWSLMHDLMICLRTVRVVLTGSGAS